MACCGGKTARRRPPKPPPVAGTDRVLLAYMGDRDRMFSWIGPATGIKYYTSSRAEDRVLAVYVEDAPGLVATGQFAEAEAE